MGRISQRTVARIMLGFSIFFLAWDVVFLIGNLAVLPSRPMIGTFWATLQVINTVSMVFFISFWRKRLRRY